MPTFDVTIEGKKYHVEIPDPGASPLQVVVDGETFDVHVSGTGITAAGGSGAGQAQLAEAPRPAPEPPALPPMPRVAMARPASQAMTATAGHEVTAPMPGTILSVEVKVGDEIAAGQVMCVLEAMKMKNPIHANFDGTVTEVAVTAGQIVAYNDVVVRLS